MKVKLTPVQKRLLPIFALLAATSVYPAAAQETPAPAATPTLTINAAEIKGKSSPILYGFMTEDINYCLEGGLYGELIANRSLQEPPANPVRWSLVQDPGASGAMEFDRSETNSANQPVSLKLTATTASDKQRVGFANEGYWGIPVRPDTTYKASFYAKADGSFTGPVTVALSSTNSPVTYAYATVPKLTNTWQKYEVTLKTAADVKPTKDAQFLIWTNSPGAAWFSLVSLFPPTYKNRPNGMRPDLMQLLADYNSAFLRFPGGNFLEGNTFATRFDWKKTLGDVSQRPGHMNDAWRYWSTDGVGLLEYLTWCEDLNMQPVLGVYAGLHLGGNRGGGRPDIAPGPELEPYVQDALDEIEYVTGDVNTKWGAQRAKDGHPAPFKLTYVEIGNEDWAGDYNGRFTQFYDAIKAKYPHLQIIDSSIRGSTNASGRLTSRATDRVADVQDSHLYTNSQMQSELHSTDYDNYDRKGPKVFEGEWATRVGTPTPNMAGALGDAAYMTGLERNSDIVIMAAYAPLFVNVSNPTNGRDPATSMQWPSDLIGFDALNSYGSPAYYAQVIFNHNRGDEILNVTGKDIGTRAYQAPAGRGGQAPAASSRELPTLFYSATRDSATGMIYLKVVNPVANAQQVKVDITGVASVAPEGEAVVLKGDSLTDTNSLAEPKKIAPVVAKVSGLSADFTRTFSPYSITILKIPTK